MLQLKFQLIFYYEILLILENERNKTACRAVVLDEGAVLCYTLFSWKEAEKQQWVMLEMEEYNSENYICIWVIPPEFVFCQKRWWLNDFPLVKEIGVQLNCSNSMFYLMKFNL